MRIRVYTVWTKISKNTLTENLKDLETSIVLDLYSPTELLINDSRSLSVKI